MSSGGSGGEAEPSAPPPATATRGGAMPKLPPRIASKQQQTAAVDGPTEDVPSGDGAATVPGTSGAQQPAPAPGPTPPSTSTSGAAAAVAAANGTTTACATGTAAAPRPAAAGPSLPPRTARPKPAAAAPPSAAALPASAPATSDGPSGGSAAAAAAPSAKPSPPGAAAASSGAAPAASSGSGGGAGTRRAPMGGLAGLPPRPQQQPQGPVLDPDEPESVAEVRRSIHAVRVQMISAALRLGYDHENALVKQVLYRLALAERLKAPWRRAGKRPDPVAAAAREAAARRAEEEAAAARAAAVASPSSSSSSSSGPPAPPPLGFTVRIMLIGLQGSGKTQLAHALLGGGPGGGSHAAVHPFEGSTRRVALLRGSGPGGIGLEFVDTPGLSLAPGGAARNCGVLQQIRRAYLTHRPDLLVYVDRLDAPTPGGSGAGDAAGGVFGAGGPGGGGGGGGALAGAELGVLRNLTAALGPAMWLNTIVAFTHAGAPPPSAPRGAGAGSRPSTSSASATPSTHSGPSFEMWLEMRSHALQGVIRQASYDERLMNPVAFAESHPACPLNAAGQPVIYNGMPWRSHLLLMLTSAKLLADTEALLQMQGGGGSGKGGAGGGLGEAAAAAGVAGGAGGAGAGGAARQVPLSYLMQQITQISRPLKFPDHRNVMDVRRARREAARMAASAAANAATAGTGKTTTLVLGKAAAAPQPRAAREAARQVALRVLALRQAARRARDMADSYRRATAAGCKIAVEPPRVARRARPSAQPLEGFRYRAPEAQGGWVVRPNIEQHCADVSDGIEGFVVNKVAVAAPGRPGEADGLKGYGVPYHHYVSMQFTKDQRMLAARSEATLYHDPLGAVTTSVSGDVQTSAAGGGGGLMAGAGGGGGDVLMLLRSDTRLRPPKGSRLPKLTVGALAARVGEEARLPLGVRLPVPRRGSSALGLRLQAIQKARFGPAGAPLRLALSAAALQRTSELSAGRLGLGLGRPRWLGGRGLLGGGSGSGGGGYGAGYGGVAGGGGHACLGASAEAVVDLADLLDLPLARRLPAAVGVNMMRSPEGDTSAALSCSLQYQLGSPGEVVAVRANWDKRGRAGLSLRLKSVSGWWGGLVAMMVPLGRLAVDCLSDAVRRIRAHRLRRRQQQQQQERLRQQQQQQQKTATAGKKTKAGSASRGR